MASSTWCRTCAARRMSAGKGCSTPGNWVLTKPGGGGGRHAVHHLLCGTILRARMPGHGAIKNVLAQFVVQTTKLTAEVCRKRGNPTLSKPMLELEQLFLDLVNHWGRGQNNGGARLSAT